MKAAAASVYVDDQQEALEFYTETLGFSKRRDCSSGDARWVTVAAPGDGEGVEVVLEPTGGPVARGLREALSADGIPVASISVPDTTEVYERLTERGVEFSTKPTRDGSSTVATFADGCGNLIRIED